MPGGKSHEGASHLPALVDPRLVKALDHVLRQHILLATVQREVSPKELSRALGEGLSQISYHVKVLREDCEGIIEETRTEPRRGAVEHYYRANVKTLLPAKAWRRLRKGLRAVVGAGQANDLFNDLAGALKAGKLQGANDLIARTPLVLDAQGKRNVKAIAQRAIEEVEDEQQAAAQRLEKANGKGNAAGYVFALLTFESAWEPATPHALEARAEIAGVSAPNRVNGATRSAGGTKRGRGKEGTAGK